jgi:hypothetical protein
MSGVILMIGVGAMIISLWLGVVAFRLGRIQAALEKMSEK